MSTYVPDAVSLLLGPHDWETWEAQTTVGEATSRPSEALPQADSAGRRPALALAASGRLTPPATSGAGEDIEIRTHWPGYLGDAAYVWRHTRHLGVVATDDYRGCDVPPAVVAQRAGGWDSDAVVRERPQGVALPDGTIVTAFAARAAAGSGAWSVRCRRWSPTTDAYSADISIVTGLADQGIGPAPTLIYLDEPDDPGIDQLLLCVYWYVDATAELATMNWSVSRDGGLTWGTWSRWTLASPVDISASGYVPGSLTAAYYQGIIGIWGEVEDPNTGATGSQIWAWVSPDYGRTVATIAGADDTQLAMARPDVCIQNDRWYLAFVRQFEAASAVVRGYLVELGTPYQSYRDLTQRQIGDGVRVGVQAGGLISDGEIAVCPWPVGRLLVLHSTYLSTGPVRLTGGGCYVDPLDPSSTTTAYAEVLLTNGWWVDGRGASATEWPLRMDLVVARAAPRLLCQIESAGTQFEDQWTDLQLGGWSTITQPLDTVDLKLAESELAAWGSITPATVSPASQGWTATGGGSLSIVTNEGSFTLTTAATQLYYHRTPSTAQRSIMVPVQVTSGATSMSRAVQVRLRVSDGATYGYDAEIRITQTEVQLYDLGGATALATISADALNNIEVLLTVDEDTGTAAAYYREAAATDQDDRDWTEISSAEALTDDLGVSGGHRVEWGLRTTDTVTAIYGILRYTPTPWYVGGVTRPADLWPGRYSPKASYVTGGAYVAASGGPAAVADYYYVLGDAQFPARNALPWGAATSSVRIRGGQRPSPDPLSGWRSSATSGVLAFRGPDGKSTRLTGGCLVCHVERPNWRQAALQIDSGGGLTTVATMDCASGATGLPYTLVGNRLYVNTGGGFTNEPVFQRGELTLGYVITPGPKVRPIIGNGGGAWSNDNTDRLPWIDIDPDSIDGTETASGNMDVIYPRATMVVWTGASTVVGWSLTWSSAVTTYEGYLRAGIVAFGSPVVPGILPDWGRSSGVVHGAELTELLTGQSIAVSQRLGRQVFRGAYAAPAPEPDGAAPFTFRGTTTGGALPVAVGGSHVSDLLGITLETDGVGKPVVYVPRAPTGTPDSYTLVGRHAGLYGRIVGEEHLATLRAADGEGLERWWEFGALEVRGEL